MALRTWSPASLTYAATTADPATDRQRHRDSLAATVRRAFAP
ncbi:transcriptional regulator [Streptomyces sp. NEAU-YJ-81]|nr:transcriptional regulator [Streptomyces sp. NEAU-YJ-81]MBO3676179.1 transcriptional regulator [Streptomyces sp. NEAU-YJ-81]